MNDDYSAFGRVLFLF